MNLLVICITLNSKTLYIAEYVFPAKFILYQKGFIVKKQRKQSYKQVLYYGFRIVISFATGK